MTLASAEAGDAPAAASAAVARPPSGTDAPYPHPQAIQNERLAILYQERSERLVALAVETNAASKATDKVESADRIRRVQEDLRALDAEIARVAKEPPPPLRNTGVTAQSTRNESGARAAANTASTTSSESLAYEGWDVFKNFGKQGAKP